MGDGRRPTLRDVAARAGVSFKTVSRVVNDEPGVSPVLTERVRQAVDELGFRPNVGARVLRRADAHTASIGLLLDDVADPFSATLLRAVQDAAVARGLAVLCASVDGDPERERSLVEAFAARGVDGLILVPSGADQSYLAAEVASGTAVVCVARAPRRLDVDAVVATDATGAASGVRHLAAHGHTRIAFLGEGNGGEVPRRLPGRAGGRRVGPATRRWWSPTSPTPRSPTPRWARCSARPTRRPRCSPRATP